LSIRVEDTEVEIVGVMFWVRVQGLQPRDGGLGLKAREGGLMFVPALRHTRAARRLSPGTGLPWVAPVGSRV
jgi:hypothetical protein